MNDTLVVIFFFKYLEKISRNTFSSVLHTDIHLTVFTCSLITLIQEKECKITLVRIEIVPIL